MCYFTIVHQVLEFGKRHELRDDTLMIVEGYVNRLLAIEREEMVDRVVLDRRIGKERPMAIILPGV